MDEIESFYRDESVRKNGDRNLPSERILSAFASDIPFTLRSVFLGVKAILSIV